MSVVRYHHTFRCRALTTMAVLLAGSVMTPLPVANAHDRHVPNGHFPRNLALQAALDQAVQAGAPGALAQTRRDGRSQRYVSGVADLKTGQRPNTDMHFRSGSVTKTFVATVVLQLAAEHRLRLDDTVERWLPGLVSGNGNNGNLITLRMLLNHTSGLYNYAEDQQLNELFEKDHFITFTPEELVRVAVSHQPDFPPGTAWGYSDTNYVLLGMVIEQATGHTYAQEITHRIIRPLRLRGTYLPGTSPGLRRPFMHGYTNDTPDGHIQDITFYNPSFAGASGEMISTAGDLDRFDSALLAGRLLPRLLLEEMLTPTPGSFPGTDFRYGYGVVITFLPCGVTVYGGGGQIAGSRSWVTGTRDGTHTMAFNVNGDWVDPSLTTSVAEFCPQGTHRGRTTR